MMLAVTGLIFAVIVTVGVIVAFGVVVLALWNEWRDGGGR